MDKARFTVVFVYATNVLEVHEGESLVDSIPLSIRVRERIDGYLAVGTAGKYDARIMLNGVIKNAVTNLYPRNQWTGEAIAHGFEFDWEPRNKDVPSKAVLVRRDPHWSPRDFYERNPHAHSRNPRTHGWSREDFS